MKKLSLMGIAIKADTDKVSLTDLWRAAGGVAHQQPAKWLENEGTLAFVNKTAEKTKSPISEVLKKKAGRNGGTFAHWQIALAYAKWLSPELHLQVNDIYRRFQEADPALAESIIDRTESVKDLKRIEARARNKASNKELNGVIKAHGGEGWIYPRVADLNNVTVTGQTAKDVRDEFGLKKGISTRGMLATDEMISMAFLEMLEAKAIAKKRCLGNKEILTTATKVARGVRDLESAYSA